MARRHLDRIILLGFAVLAVLLYISTASYPGIAQKTSALYVRFLAISMGILSIVQLGFSMFRDHDTGRLELTDHWPRFIGLLVALIVFALVFEHAGFYLSAAVFIPVTALLLGYRNYPVIALTTAGVLGFVYLVFEKLLSVNLPGMAL